MTDGLTWTRNDLSFLLLTLALAIFAVAPLTYPGYLQVHSGFLPAYNLADLAGGSLNVGWKPAVATSYDPLRGDGVLPYYAASPLLWLGASSQNAVKSIFGLSFFLGAAGFYLWMRLRLGPWGAALAALVYTYLPYRLATVYVRGSWGEALFLGLLPWAIAAATARIPPRSWRISDLFPAALAWLLLGLSQSGLAVWGFLLLVIWVLWVDRSDQSGEKDDRKNRPYGPMLAGLGGVLAALASSVAIAGFSVAPSPIDFFDHFVFPAQLFSAYWGFGASRTGWEDGLALGFGFAAVGLSTLTLILAYGRRRGKSQDSGLNPLALSLTILILTLALLPQAALFWRLPSLHRTLTYPWQLLGPIGLCLSALAGASLRSEGRLAAAPAYACLVILALLPSYSYLEPRFTQKAPGQGPLAAWDAHHLLLLDYELSVEIPPGTAGLVETSPGRLPLADYGPPQPGDSLHLSLTWQAARPFYRDLKVFLHLLDTSGHLIAQVDPSAGSSAGPEGSDYFTSDWEPGRLIIDEVSITIPPDAPPGPYRLAFGLYDGATLERLPVTGREDGQVEIKLGDTGRQPGSLSLSDPSGVGGP